MVPFFNYIAHAIPFKSLFEDQVDRKVWSAFNMLQTATCSEVERSCCMVACTQHRTRGHTGNEEWINEGVPGVAIGKIEREKRIMGLSSNYFCTLRFTSQNTVLCRTTISLPNRLASLFAEVSGYLSIYTPSHPWRFCSIS